MARRSVDARKRLGISINGLDAAMAKFWGDKNSARRAGRSLDQMVKDLMKD